MTKRKQKKRQRKRRGSPQQQQRARSEPPPQPAPQNPSPIEANHSGVGSSPGNEQRCAPNQSARVERLQAGFSAALVFAAFVAIGVSWWQLGTMRQQNDVMIEQNKIVEKQLSQMADQNEIARGQLKQMIADKRPWIGIKSPELSDPSANGDRHLSIQAKNYGETPGTVIHIAAEIVPIRAEMKRVDLGPERSMIPFFKLDSIIDRLSALPNHAPTSGVIPPGEMHDAGLGEVNPGKEFEPRIFGRNDDSITMLFVLVTYLDGTGGKHRTLASFAYDADIKKLVSSPRYNRMD
jgi:hypothetical protein